jgi:hypothetical protein
MASLVTGSQYMKMLSGYCQHRYVPVFCRRFVLTTSLILDLAPCETISQEMEKGELFVFCAL